MKKFSTGIIILVIAIFLIGFYIVTSNKMVVLNNDVKLKWGAVETAYQRRADLITQLAATVKKATNYERETLTAVVEARARATSVQIDPSNLTPEKLAEFQKAQAGLNSALSRLLVSVEKYPDLKANQSILAFQSQLEGTENRIKIDRDNYNISVTEYNNYITKLPYSIISSIKGLKEKTLFKSFEGSDKSPDVDLLLNGEK
ncbi:LemA family protein [Apibacter muscae]|uniref:LemA family protein n=1 Tax=Apibacter muscae TaxID=2509004 RepID=UPI0011ACC5FE|nr:LemA family protein [Apibacter muscae]TWP27974.1 LemA family protein [Apibacter muscae]